LGFEGFRADVHPGGIAWRVSYRRDLIVKKIKIIYTAVIERLRRT